MKNKLLIISILLSTVSTMVIAQQFKMNLPAGYNKIYTDNNLPKGMEGSPYLSEDWQPGTVLLKNGKSLEGLNYRYNVYKKEMQYKWNNDIYVIGTPDSIKTIEIAGKNFIYSSFYNVLKTDKSFFEISVDGNIQFLILYTTEIVKANFNIAMNVGNKNDAIELKKKFYISIGGEILPIDKKGKILFAKLPEKTEEIKNFVKTNKLSYTKELDLKLIINFCNTLK